MTNVEFTSPECWLDPNEGTWLTFSEATLMTTYLVLPVGLLLILFCVMVLRRLNWINPRTGFLIGLLGLSTLIPITAAHMLTNDGYIDRLYEACQNNQGTSIS